MGIQINGQTDTISAVDGALTVSGADLPTVTNLNATGISTFSKGIVIGTGTSISSPTTNTLTLGTNNAERVRVSDGGVSIGTVTTYGDSNASFTSLSLGGNGTRYGLLEIKQSNSVAGSWIDCYGTNGNGDLRITTAGTSNNITFWTGGAFTEKVRITSGGNIGVGSTNPGFQLTVDQGTTDGNLFDLKNEEVRLLTGVWGTGSTYPREVTLNGTRFDSGSLPSLRLAGQGGIKFAVDLNTVRMEIDSSGRITKPYQPSFSVYRGTNQTISHNTNTKVQWNTEVFDIGSNFDSSTNYRFTAPVAGKYLFMGHLYIYPTYQVEAHVYKNGSQYKRFSGPLGSGGNDNPNGIDFMDIVDLAVNDYVEIYALQARTGDTANADIYGGGIKETSFVGYLIG